VVSERDRQEMTRRCPFGRTIVVPNGVDTRAFQPVADLEAPGVLFTASFDYQPNLDAAAELCEVIWPRVQATVPEATLSIVGRNPPARLLLECWLRGIEVAANVPDLAPYAARCSVSAVPVRVGGGSRLKILTSLALGLPVVTTSLGLEGLGLAEGEGVLVEDDPARFADLLARLLRDRPLRASLSQAGRAAMEARYDWHQILLPYERHLISLARGHRSPEHAHTPQVGSA
jgi:glycosyltransferase involved in cell wall biosynthesis